MAQSAATPVAPASELAPAAGGLQEILRDSQIESVLHGLDRDFVALSPVKKRIREIAALLVIDRLRREAGLSAERPSLHMCFTGNPGTGKTTVAMRMAEILKGLGYIDKGHLIAVTRDDLVGQYVGHTAPKTKEVLKRAYGGVLFIDEAYYLHRAENERDYGIEAIEILLQAMENDRDKVVVILAGYEDRMDGFFRTNPGMGSRVAHHIDFPDYTLDELMEIGDLMLDHQNYEFTPQARVTFREYLELRMRQPRFAAGRSVRNAMERARLRQASRLFDAGSSGGEVITRADLLRLEDGDIRASRVFSTALLSGLDEDGAARQQGESDGDLPAQS